MTQSKYMHLMEGALAACREASARIVEIYDAGAFKIDVKDDDSPLTQADTASHQLLVNALQRLAPNIPILSEESAEVSFEERRQWNQLWIVDPLDGTREFIKRNGEFTINVAFIENQRPVFGVIAVPVKDVAYSGIIGEGAWRWRDWTQSERIATRRPVTKPLVVAATRSHGNKRSENYLKLLGPHRLLTRGSALKFCAVAEGSADLYPRLGPTSEWDTAAGDALVTAAGGRVTLLDRRELRYNARKSLLNTEFIAAGDPDLQWPDPGTDNT